MNKEELKNLILAKEKEGRIVFATFEGLMDADIEDFLHQPTEGILYDLNRLKEVSLSRLDDPKWINDFAVAVVITKLKDHYDKTLDKA